MCVIFTTRLIDYCRQKAGLTLSKGLSHKRRLQLLENYATPTAEISIHLEKQRQIHFPAQIKLL